MRPPRLRPAIDRRHGPDRRRRPTTLLGALRWGGRRRGFRRENEGRSAYVDHVRLEVLLLVLFVMLASAFDAYFTLLHLQVGGVEANPVMLLAVERGPLFFVSVKMALTAGGCLLLAAHQLFPLGILGLRLLAGGYSILLAYHALLFWVA